MIQRRTLKDSANKGREFYVCAKPEGRKGDPTARCDGFIWLDMHRKQAQK